MPKGLSFEEYKLLKDKPDSFELVHPDGSNFSVAKKGLDESMISRIGGMPYFEAPIPNSSPVPQPDPMATPPAEPEKQPLAGRAGIMQGMVDNLVEGGKKVLGGRTGGIAEAVGEASRPKPPLLADNTGGMLVEGAEVPLENTVAAPIAPQAAVPGSAAQATSAMPTGMNSAYAMQAQGIQNAANAQAQAATEQAAAHEAHQQKLLEQQTRYDNAFNKLTADNDALEKDILDDKIEPRKMFGEMSTGNKLLAGLAIALGGIGQGLMKTDKNAAVEMLNKMLQDDIEAQKANLDKKKGLLSNNLQKVRDLQTAEQLTRSQLLAITQAEVSKAVAKAGSDEAKARGQVLLGQLKQQQEVLKAEIAKKAAVAQVGQPGVKVNPEALPPEMRERMVMAPTGQQYLALGKKEAEELREEISTINPIFEQLDQLEALGPAILSKDKREKAELIIANLTNLLKQNQGMAKPGYAMGKDDYVSVQQQFDDPRKVMELFGSGKSPALKAFIMSKLNAKLRNNVSNFKEPFRARTEAPGYAKR
jgi:hypothetical protein